MTILSLDCQVLKKKTGHVLTLAVTFRGLDFLILVIFTSFVTSYIMQAALVS